MHTVSVCASECVLTEDSIHAWLGHHRNSGSGSSEACVIAHTHMHEGETDFSMHVSEHNNKRIKSFKPLNASGKFIHFTCSHKFYCVIMGRIMKNM